MSDEFQDEFQSAVFIIPDADREAGNAYAEKMGWGPNTYSVPLSPTGSPPATHWGCRAQVGPAFRTLLAQRPEDARELLDKARINVKRAAEVAEIKAQAGPHDHWQAELAPARMASSSARSASRSAVTRASSSAVSA